MHAGHNYCGPQDFLNKKKSYSIKEQLFFYSVRDYRFSTKIIVDSITPKEELSLKVFLLG